MAGMKLLAQLTDALSDAQWKFLGYFVIGSLIVYVSAIVANIALLRALERALSAARYSQARANCRSGRAHCGRRSRLVCLQAARLAARAGKRTGRAEPAVAE